MKSTVNAILAIDLDHGIGKQNQIPWYYPDDLSFFRKITTGEGNNAIIVGKNTFLSLSNSFPLPKRRNAVVSETLYLEADRFPNRGYDVFRTLDEAVDYYDQQGITEIVIAGGKALYEEVFKKPYLKTVYLTRIFNRYDCDVTVDLNEVFRRTIQKDVIFSNDFLRIELLTLNSS